MAVQPRALSYNRDIGERRANSVAPITVEARRSLASHPKNEMFKQSRRVIVNTWISLCGLGSRKKDKVRCAIDQDQDPHNRTAAPLPH